jgi:2-methylcitrate dehydratase PrpD
MHDPIDQLAQFVAETRWNEIPEAVRQHAKLVLLDTVGVILAGSEQPEVRQIRSQLLPNSGAGATVFARDCPLSNPHTAALLNGIAGRSIELCEGHRYVSCQGAIQIVPTVLALGESGTRPGRDLLSALILGYDTAVRIGSGVTPRALAHQNGQAPLLGAVAAGARLRGLNAADTGRALRLAATLLLTPSYTNAVAGATVLNVAGGMSGFIGALAPELALAGFEAQDNAIAEAFSSLVGDGFQPAGIADALGQRWEISRNYFRLRACCNPIYAALDALEAILDDLKPAADAIDRIEAATYQFASAMQNPAPRNTFAARYSFPHAAAALVIKGHAGYDAFTEDALHDPAMAALRQRVHLSADPELSAQAPQLKPARVTLTLKDGRQQTRLCESARGDFQRPYAESELRAKFHQLAAVVLTSDGVNALETSLDRCDEWGNMQELTDVIRSHSRPAAV